MTGNQAAGIRPEKLLLLCCARTRVNAVVAERIRALASAELDWPYLLAAAAQNGVAPLLYWQLRATCPESVPQVWMEQLRAEFRQNTVRNLFLAGELCEILEGLRAQGIPAIPYKGPLLAVQAYGNVALRQFVDLDIVLRQRDVVRAHEVLTSRGYRGEFLWSEPPAAQRIPGQYHFARDAGRLVVELHTERTLRYFPQPVDLEQLAGRLRPVSLDGRAILTFSAEDALPILCVHGSKHFWEQLSWISDIGELAQGDGGVDWEAAVNRALQLGAGRMMHLGLYLANDLLDAPLPKMILERVRGDRAVRALSGRVRQRFFSDWPDTPGVVERFWFRLRMRGNAWTGVRYVLRLATAPTEDDWSRTRLSPALSPLYAAVRPFRLLRKYGLGLARRSPHPTSPKK